MLCCASKRPKNGKKLGFNSKELREILKDRNKYIEKQNERDRKIFEEIKQPYDKRIRFDMGEQLEMAKTFLSLSKGKKYLKRDTFIKKFALLGNKSSKQLVGRIFDILINNQKINQVQQYEKSFLDSNDKGMNLNTFLDYFEVVEKGSRSNKLLLSFEILDGPEGDKVITSDNFYKLTSLLCKINAYLTGQEFSITQVKSIVSYLLKDMDQDSNTEVDFEEFYSYYTDKEDEEFFELLYGKGIEKQMKDVPLTRKERKIRKDLITIYQNLMIYFQYYKDQLAGPSKEGKKYPLVQRRFQVNNVLDQQLAHYNRFQAIFGKLALKAVRKKMGKLLKRRGSKKWSMLISDKQKQNLDILNAAKTFNHPIKKDTKDSKGFEEIKEISENPLRESVRGASIHSGSQSKQPAGDVLPDFDKEGIEKFEKKDSHKLETKASTLRRTGTIVSQYAAKSGGLNRKDAEEYFMVMVDNTLAMFRDMIKTLIEGDEDPDNPELLSKETRDMNKLLNEEKKKKKKSKGLVFIFDNSWDLVLGIMIGMGKSVRSLSAKNIPSDIEDDFKFSKNSFQFQLPNSSDPENMCIFEDYGPELFRTIREASKIDSETYLKSIGPEKLMMSLLGGDIATLTELISPGKSGSFLYFTYDGSYILKSIMKKEFYFFKKVLVKYFKYIIQNPESLIARYFGLQRLSLVKKGKKEVYYLVVMRNIFKTNKKLHYRFDLKGSTYKRITKLEGLSNDEISRKTLKDLNFRKMKKEGNVDISVSPRMHAKLMNSLEKDSNFLAEIKVIDYSLLVGVHNESNSPTSTENTNLVSNRITKHEIIEEKIDSGGCVARSMGEKKRVYFMGIIDTFIEFVFKKKLEYISRTCIQGKGVSCVPPKAYAKRFHDFFKDNIERDGQKIKL